jgi:hypothetical protein
MGFCLGRRRPGRATVGPGRKGRWRGAIGLNLHLDFCEIAICEDGKLRSAGRVASTPEALAVLAESLLPSDRVALEVICAASFLAAIGDIRRFKTSRQLAAYLGLTGRCVIRPPRVEERGTLVVQLRVRLFGQDRHELRWPKCSRSRAAGLRGALRP